MYKENIDNGFEVNEIIAKINEISKKHDILHEINEKLTVLNLNNEISYIGSIKIFDENKLPKFEKNLKELLNKYGNNSVRSEEVISCCKPPYTNISFKINISK